MSHVVTLLDVTLRDGGYVNGHAWSTGEASNIVAACRAAHVPYCEVGYYRPRRHERDGSSLPSACSPPSYLERLHETYPGVTLVVMAHAHEVELSEYHRLAECGVGMVRLPTRIDVLSTLPAHVKAAKQAGLRVTLNLIRVSEVTLEDVALAAKIASECDVDALYLADSNGSLFPPDVTRIVQTAAETSTVRIGFHAHDGLSLAFINSLTAVQAGCTYLDASLGGMGKGGGNLALELIVGYLRARAQAQLSMVPLVRTAAEVLQPWKTGIEARCDSIASGLLDLNMDKIAQTRGVETEVLSSLVDALPI